MNAVIKITGEINEEESLRICEEFAAAERDPEVEQIVFCICSAGGNTTIVAALWELFKMSQKPVCTIGTSVVCSTAALIFMMAPRRILLPNTQFLLHKSTCKLDGMFTADELEDLMKESRRLDRIFLAPVLVNSRVSKSVLYKKTRRLDWTLTDAEIEKYGITTEPYNKEEVRKLLLED